MADHHRRCVESRLSPLPPLSNRTLPHPSFLPLYVATGSSPHVTYRDGQTVHPVTPGEVFYSDPLMGPGGRVPNAVTDWLVSGFRINPPPPVMSTRVAPPPQSDPFRCGRPPIRDLGSPTVTFSALLPPAPPTPIILQLTGEEDQAITNLLKLHYQDPPGAPPLCHPPQSPALLPRPLGPPNTSGVGGPLLQGGSWSWVELEAANTLSGGFSVTLVTSSGRREFWETCVSPASQEEQEPPDLEGRLLSHREGDAVSVLLSLGGGGPPRLTV